MVARFVTRVFTALLNFAKGKGSVKTSGVKWALKVFIVSWLFSAAVATAHPLSQGALNGIVYPDRIAISARITAEEVMVTDMIAGGDTPADGAGGSVYERHAAYLAKHIHIVADGVPLTGRVVSALPPSTQPTTRPLAPDKQHAVYELENPCTARPQNLKLTHDVLVGVALAPGVTWETSYAVRIGVENGPVSEGLLLTATQPVDFTCDWTASAGAAPTGRARLMREYAVHGIHHILGGYDHLLFISALVLAAVSLWDLVKVVSAFTLAHTITLTLASLRVVAVPSWVVEPMIAASIVFVALQNVFWPRQSRGWTRLAVAFGFGLFHGLGFAGGLLDAMQGMSGVTVVLAILGFSVGVELGHQLIVLPLFGVLKAARGMRHDDLQRDRLSMRALRYGSAVISLAGLYYLVLAITTAIRATPPA
jgi:hypothetical protein